MLDVRGWRRVAAAQLTIDESTAVAVGQRDAAAARTGFWATGLGVFVCWNLMTLVGVPARRRARATPRRYGLDAAAAARVLRAAVATAAIGRRLRHRRPGRRSWRCSSRPTRRPAYPCSSPRPPPSWPGSGAAPTTTRHRRTTGRARAGEGPSDAAVSTWTAVLAGLGPGLRPQAVLGYVVPTRWLDGDRTTRITSALPDRPARRPRGRADPDQHRRGDRASTPGLAAVAVAPWWRWLLRAPVHRRRGARRPLVAAGLRLLGLP